MRRRLESEVIVTNSHRLDFFLGNSVFTAWYTQPGVLEVTERVTALLESFCGACWTKWWAWQAAG